MGSGPDLRKNMEGRKLMCREMWKRFFTVEVESSRKRATSEAWRCGDGSREKWEGRKKRKEGKRQRRPITPFPPSFLIPSASPFISLPCTVHQKYIETFLALNSLEQWSKYPTLSYSTYDPQPFNEVGVPVLSDNNALQFCSCLYSLISSTSVEPLGLDIILGGLYILPVSQFDSHSIFPFSLPPFLRSTPPPFLPSSFLWSGSKRHHKNNHQAKTRENFTMITIGIYNDGTHTHTNTHTSD